MSRIACLAGATVAWLAFAFATASQGEPEPPSSEGQALRAIAVIHPSGEGGILGKVSFRPAGDSLVVRAEIGGLEARKSYTMKIHVYGDCSSGDLRSAGEVVRSADALIDFESGTDGWADLLFSDRTLRLDRSRDSILGRSVVIHQAEQRVACATIGLASSMMN